MPITYTPRSKRPGAVAPAPVENKGLIERGFEAYNTPIVDLLGQGEAVDRLAQPGMADVQDGENILQKAVRKGTSVLKSPLLKGTPMGIIGDFLDTETVREGLPTTKAKAKGFVTGSTKAVTPALVAQGASLGTGVPAIVANTAIAAQGLKDVTDSDKSAFERGMGAVGLLGGGAGASAGVKTAKATKAASAGKPKTQKFEIETTARTGPGTMSATGGKITPETRTKAATLKGAKLTEQKPVSPIAAATETPKAPISTAPAPVDPKLAKPVSGAVKLDGTPMTDAEWKQAVADYNKSVATGPKPSTPSAAKVPYSRPAPGPSKAAVAAEAAAARAKAGEAARDARNLKAVEAWKARNDALKAKQAAEAAKIAENESKLAAIEAAKEGRKATKPSINESITAKTPEGGRASMSRRFVKPTPPDKAGIPINAVGQAELGLPPARPAPAAAAKAPVSAAQKFDKKVSDIVGKADDIDPRVDPAKIAGKKYSNKQEAAAVAKAAGGTVHQDGPRQYSIRFADDIPEPEVITPTPTIKLPTPTPKKDMPRATAPEKGPDTPVPTGPRVVGYGNEWSVAGRPDLGTFPNFRAATQAMNSLTDATPAEAVKTMQELAAVTSKPAPPVGTLKFPTSKLPGKSQAPVAEQADLLAPTKGKVIKTPRVRAAEREVPPQTPESVAKAKADMEAEQAKLLATQKAEAERLAGQQIKTEAKEARKGFKVVEPGKPAKGGAIPVRLQKKQDVLGEAYKQTQAAEKAGEIPKNDPFYATDKRGRPITPARMQGAGLAEAKAAKPVPPKADIAPGPGVVTPDDLKNLSPDEQMAAVTKLVDDFFKKGKGKGPKGGSTVSAFGAGQLDNMVKIAAENPAFTRAMTTIAGAGVGAGTSEDPVTGAVIGGAVGFGAPTLFNAINKARVAGMPDEGLVAKSKDMIDTLARMLPDFQRAALLSKPLPLLMNSVVGPWGAIIMHGLEDAARLDKRGLRLLTLALNPKNFPKEYIKSFPKAKELIHSAAERTEGVMGEMGPAWYRTATTYPGIAMTAGDEAARELAKLAGYTDEEARAMTLTSEPYTSVGAGVSKLKKGARNRETGKRTWLLDMSLPFYRTATNQIEQGLERTPFIGMWMNRYAKSKPAAWQQQVAQQVIGGNVGVASYMLGEETPPEDAKYVLKFINNFGGQYGAIASAGFMMGQASARGMSDWRALTAELTQAVPMPSTQPITDVMQPLGQITGLGPEPTEQQKASGLWVGDVKVPSGMVPGILDPEDPLTGLLVGSVMPQAETPAPAPSGISYIPRARR